MTVVPPASGEPRRPEGPRDPGDAWVVADSGERYWGRYGAAGLLAHDPARGVLLQHRVAWSHFGGTWGLPGGALHEGESAIVGAVREAQEEAGVPDGAVRPRFTSVLDLSVWSYTTVVADVVVPFEPVISDPESVALEWVPLAEVESRPLHPGFASAWPLLRSQLEVRPVLVVDAANVVGSVPDGWWKDRAAAAARLRDRLRGVAVDAAELDLPGTVWFPEVSLVVEGRARTLADVDAKSGTELHSGTEPQAGAEIGVDVSSTDVPSVEATFVEIPSADSPFVDLPSVDVSSVEAPPVDLPSVDVTVVRAEASGDDAIVEEAARLLSSGRTVTVVTSDRGLIERVEAIGAQTQSAGWLLRTLDRHVS